MAVTFDAAGAGVAVTTNNVATEAHVVGLGATALFVYAAVNPWVVQSYTAFATRTATYNGVAMTSLGAVNSNNSNDGFIELFYLEDPPAGNHNVVVTMNDGTNQCYSIVVGSVSYFGVGSLGTPVTGYTSGTTGSVTVASDVDQIVIAGFACGKSIGSPSDTQRYLNNNNAHNAAGNLLIQDQVGQTSSVLSATASTDFWAWIGVALQPTSVLAGGNWPMFFEDLLGTGEGGTPTPPVTPPPPSGGGSAQFNGDFSTGNFSQWAGVQFRSGAGYAATIATVDGAPCFRCEVRSGDNPGFSPGTERCEVAGPSSSSGISGETLWFTGQIKFDPSFPQNFASLGWGLVTQWHGNTVAPSMSWQVGRRNGYLTFTMQPQAAVNQWLGDYSIWEVPLGTGWHVWKTQICFSSSDSVGFVRLWYNNVRQTFLDGTTTHFKRTVVPGQEAAHGYAKQGLYRAPMAPTAILYHRGFRCATTEAGLA